jgi:hypothetical protein
VKLAGHLQASAAQMVAGNSIERWLSGAIGMDRGRPPADPEVRPFVEELLQIVGGLLATPEERLALRLKPVWAAFERAVAGERPGWMSARAWPSGRND